MDVIEKYQNYSIVLDEKSVLKIDKIMYLNEQMYPNVVFIIFSTDFLHKIDLCEDELVYLLGIDYIKKITYLSSKILFSLDHKYNGFQVLVQKDEIDEFILKIERFLKGETLKNVLDDDIPGIGSKISFISIKDKAILEGVVTGLQCFFNEKRERIVHFIQVKVFYDCGGYSEINTKTWLTGNSKPN